MAGVLNLDQVKFLAVAVHLGNHFCIVKTGAAYRILVVGPGDDGHAKGLMKFAKGDGKIAHSRKRLADDADARATHLMGGSGNVTQTRDAGDDIGGEEVAGFDKIRQTAAAQQICQILDTMDAVVEHDFVRRCVSGKTIFLGRVEHDHRPAETLQGVDAFQRRRVGQVQRDDRTDIGGDKLVDRSGEFGLNTADRCADPFDRQLIQFGLDAGQVLVDARPDLRLGLIIEFQVKRQEADPDLCFFRCGLSCHIDLLI